VENFKLPRNMLNCLGETNHGITGLGLPIPLADEKRATNTNDGACDGGSELFHGETLFSASLAAGEGSWAKHLGQAGFKFLP